MQAHIQEHVMSSTLTPYTDLHRNPPPVSINKGDAGTVLNESGMRSIAMENAVVVVSKRGCCMTHVVTRLLSTLGVNPRVVEVEMDNPLVNDDCNTPAVFIGGRLLGGVDRLLAAHIAGNLIPQLKAAGALWL